MKFASHHFAQNLWSDPITRARLCRCSHAFLCTPPPFVNRCFFVYAPARKRFSEKREIAWVLGLQCSLSETSKMRKNTVIFIYNTLCSEFKICDSVDWFGNKWSKKSLVIFCRVRKLRATCPFFKIPLTNAQNSLLALFIWLNQSRSVKSLSSSLIRKKYLRDLSFWLSQLPCSWPTHEHQRRVNHSDNL